jgi:hypothetical protein
MIVLLIMLTYNVKYASGKVMAVVFTMKSYCALYFNAVILSFTSYRSCFSSFGRNETEASCAVNQIRVVAIWRPSVEWQRGGVEVGCIRVVLLREAIRGVAAWMDVRADGGHWSWAGSGGCME